MTTSNAYYLDNFEFYPIDPAGTTQIPVIAGADFNTSPYPGNNWIGMGDMPGIGCQGDSAYHGDFTGYVRFRPNGDDSIFVTLGKLNWHIYMTAALGTNGYAVTSDDGDADPHVTPSSEFPRWTNILHNQ